jgi:hypothetical protein
MPIIVQPHGPGRGPAQGAAGARSITFSGPWLLVPMLIVAAVLLPFVLLAGLVVLGVVLAYGAFLLLRLVLGVRRARRAAARGTARTVTVERVRTGSTPFDDGWPGEAQRP